MYIIYIYMYIYIELYILFWIYISYVYAESRFGKKRSQRCIIEISLWLRNVGFDQQKSGGLHMIRGYIVWDVTNNMVWVCFKMGHASRFLSQIGNSWGAQPLDGRIGYYNFIPLPSKCTAHSTWLTSSTMHFADLRVPFVEPKKGGMGRVRRMPTEPWRHFVGGPIILTHFLGGQCASDFWTFQQKQLRFNLCMCNPAMAKNPLWLMAKSGYFYEHVPWSTCLLAQNNQKIAHLQMMFLRKESPRL